MPAVTANLSATLAVVALLGALTAAVYAVGRQRARRGIVTATQRATYEVLHTAALAAEPLRGGLRGLSSPGGRVGAGKAARHLRALVGAVGLAITDRGTVLVFDGEGAHHEPQLEAAVTRVVAAGRATVLSERDLVCDRVDCQAHGAIVVPLTGPDSGPVVGTLIAVTDGPPTPGLVRAALETAGWVAAQLSLAELDSSRSRLARAELRALRAQISPHFIYNALTAIASFVRTDAEQARELILEFAEFTRYSFRSHGEFTTLAEELRSIDRYLTIERARFGERLQVRLQIAPEVLPVGLPYLCLQPLVENAVRHGLSGKPGVGTVSIIARDAGTECVITVEDDGVGMDPELLRADDSDESSDAGQHVGLSNVDDRLRSVFGEPFGLVVETALGAGTKVSVRVPKFHPSVHAARAA